MGVAAVGPAAAVAAATPARASLPAGSCGRSPARIFIESAGAASRRSTPAATAAETAGVRCDRRRPAPPVPVDPASGGVGAPAEQANVAIDRSAVLRISRSPPREMTTAMPEKITATPEVDIAPTRAVSGSCPAAISSRYRASRKSE